MAAEHDVPPASGLNRAPQITHRIPEYRYLQGFSA